MISFWEQDACFETDCIIIGSGIIGLSTAIELKQQRPRARIVVFERGLFGEGASTKNAGFACVGSLSEIASDIDRYGSDAAFSLVEQRWRGLSILRKRLGDTAIEFEQFGGYELLFESNFTSVINRLDEVNALIFDIFRRPLFSAVPQRIQDFGFAGMRDLLFNPLEGQIHSGKMILSLRNFALSIGVEILSGASVTDITEHNNRVIAEICVSSERLKFTANSAAVCTNGYLKNILPKIDISPGRGQVILTEPIDKLPFHGAFHFDEGFYYFRNVGNRVLFGGGRNLDFDGERTECFGLSETIQTALEQYLSEIILPQHRVGIASRWSGIMGFSRNKLPITEHYSPRIVVGFGCNGMGVALGSIIGNDVAELLANIE
ncbi:FAD-dependent oxidoreductase [Ignavibacteria bacterium]|nr:FAD-binding oxidoreductase [Bacteroidota bacterium]MCZ2132069.1 FAD-binding oxidoreductase [Bacteroidota bacterium]